MEILVGNCREFETSTTHFNHPSFDAGVILANPWHKSVINKPLKKALALVHGFGGTYENVTKAYEEMEKQIISMGGLGYDAIMRFYWPGSWSKTIGFLLARRRVNEAARRLQIYLSQLVSNYGVEEITVQAHSLGCDISQKVLNRTRFSPLVYKEKYKYVFCAPALTNSYYENGVADLRQTNPMITLPVFPELKIAYSKNDPVLKYAFRLAPGNWGSSAIGYSPSTANLTTVGNFFDMSASVKTHTGYRKIKEYYELMRA